MNAYTGQILVADLSKGETKPIKTSREISANFLGGSGFASRFLYDHLDASINPLSPENMLLFMTGPLAGTLAPCTGRHVVCGKSPLTNLWGESHVGGHFGAFLKFSGFDGVLIKGRSEKPMTLHIENGHSELLHADDLWGMMTGPTQDTLKKTLGRVQVACIGPAGENLVRFASIVTNERV